MSLLVNIPYLEVKDLNTDGSLKPHVNKGKSMVVLMQGNFCGFCTQAKPIFQQFTASHPGQVATIQTDGKFGGPAANALLKNALKSIDMRGVPLYLGFNKAGKCVTNEVGLLQKAQVDQLFAAIQHV